MIAFVLAIVAAVAVTVVVVQHNDAVKQPERVNVVASESRTGVAPSRADCNAELSTVETAQEAFLAQYGAYPKTMTDLVSHGFLRTASTHFDVDSFGHVTPTSAGGCS